jgi:hypothetical protein
LRSVANLNAAEIDKTVKLYKEYESLLFNENTPVLTNGSPYSLLDDGRDAKRMRVFKELEDLAANLLNSANAESPLLPGLRSRHKKLLDNFLNPKKKKIASKN